MSRQVVLVDSSHFVDRDSVANGRRAVCDIAKFRYKSLCCRLLFEPRKIFVRFSNIRSFANTGVLENFERMNTRSGSLKSYLRIFEQFVSTLINSSMDSHNSKTKKKEEGRNTYTTTTTITYLQKLQLDQTERFYFLITERQENKNTAKIKR